MLTLDVRKRLGALQIEAAFEAGPGVTVLFGRSGCGKTSLLNMIAGLMRPDAGRVTFDGEMLDEPAARRFVAPHRRRIGYVFQDALLFPHLDVRGNLLFARRHMTGAPDPHAFARVVDMLGIGGLLARAPASLSGGERQRVAIGRALLAEPRLLLCDEPLASLDEERKADILPYLDRLRREARAPIVYVTHSMAEVARLADRVVLLRDGRVIASGAPQDVLHRADLLDPENAGESAALFDARVAALEADGLARLDCALGPLLAPARGLSPGQKLRLRVFARDVIIARARPPEISALNVFAGIVREVRRDDGQGATQGSADIEIACGAGVLWARVTTRSIDALALAPGVPVHAIVKGVALDPEG